MFAGLSLYALGGRVRDVGADETAFFYRNAKYILWLETIWEEQGAAEVNRAWVHRRFPVLAEVSKGAYVNFPYRLLPHSLQAYYGAHAAFLQHVKEKYDPYNVFGFPQGICRQGSVVFPQARPAVPVYAEKSKRTDDAFYRRARYVRDI